MGFLRDILGLGPKVNYKELVSNGATIIDVRSKGEFISGHAKGAVNIPLDQLPQQIAKIKKMNQPLVLCCRSGMRSGQATRQLKAQGFEAHNAGPWTNLR